MTWNSTSNKFDVSVPASYTDSNVRTVLSTSVGTGLSWNFNTNRMNVVFPPSPLPYGDAEVRIVLSTSAGTNMTWKTSTNKFDVANANSTTTLGVAKQGTNTIISNGVISVPNANGTTTLGVVRQGTNITIVDGVISATAGALQPATTTTLGGVQIGTNINVLSGVISVPNANPVSRVNLPLVLTVPPPPPLVPHSLVYFIFSPVFRAFVLLAVFVLDTIIFQWYLVNPHVESGARARKARHGQGQSWDGLVMERASLSPRRRALVPRKTLTPITSLRGTPGSDACGPSCPLARHEWF
jgi:hypothetical protein